MDHLLQQKEHTRVKWLVLSMLQCYLVNADMDGWVRGGGMREGKGKVKRKERRGNSGMG